MSKCHTRYCRNKKALGRNFCEKCRSRRFKEINPTGYHFNLLRSNAKRRGKVFTLTLAEFREFCKETGYIELKGRCANAMSIDRKDHTKGYTKDNIQIMRYGENSTKGNHEKNDCPF